MHAVWGSKLRWQESEIQNVLLFFLSFFVMSFCKERTGAILKRLITYKARTPVWSWDQDQLGLHTNNDKTIFL